MLFLEDRLIYESPREVENSSQTIIFHFLCAFCGPTLKCSISELSGSTMLCFGYVSVPVGGSSKKWSSSPPTTPPPPDEGWGLRKVEMSPRSRNIEIQSTVQIRFASAENSQKHAYLIVLASYSHSVGRKCTIGRYLNDSCGLGPQNAHKK